MIEAAAERLKPQLDEVRAENAMLYKAQAVIGALKHLSATAEAALAQFAELEAAAEQAREQKMAARHG